MLDLAHRGPGETHDFESLYLQSLIGPPAEVPARYAEALPDRTPTGSPCPSCCSRARTTSSARPPSASASSPGSRAGAPHAYLTFAGEGHGFRRADTMIRALEAELSLYAQVFGLEPTPSVPKVG